MLKPSEGEIFALRFRLCQMCWRPASPTRVPWSGPSAAWPVSWGNPFSAVGNELKVPLEIAASTHPDDSYTFIYSHIYKTKILFGVKDYQDYMNMFMIPSGSNSSSTPENNISSSRKRQCAVTLAWFLLVSPSLASVLVGSTLAKIILPPAPIKIVDKLGVQKTHDVFMSRHDMNGSKQNSKVHVFAGGLKTGPIFKHLADMWDTRTSRIHWQVRYFVHVQCPQHGHAESEHFSANLRRKKRQNPRTRVQKRKLRENCNTATLSYSTFSYSSYSTLSYSGYSQLLYWHASKM